MNMRQDILGGKNYVNSAVVTKLLKVCYLKTEAMFLAHHIPELP
jgi:hypothetical protein